MKILLFQLDGSLPNLALMRLRAHFDSSEVCLRQPVKASDIQPELWYSPDAVYASLIFEKTRPLAEHLLTVYPTAVIGGTGWDLTTTLEQHGIGNTLNYSIYPHYPHSIGFTQRGCRFKCPFCVVPQKEGKNRSEMVIRDIWRGDPWPRNIILLDNDFFGQKEWPKRIGELIFGDYKVNFNQGINARTLNEDAAGAVSMVRYYDSQFKTRRIYTAWDNRGDEKRLFRGLELLVKHGVKPDHIMVYMLIGYWPGETLEDWEYRRVRLREFGARPYPMPYVRTKVTVGFQRWVVGAYDKRVPWIEWVKAGYEPRRIAC